MYDRLDRHVAAKDTDNDGFSDIGALRGYWWKGIDFEDEDNQVYPGRFPENGDEYFDSNCNYLEGRIQDPGRSEFHCQEIGESHPIIPMFRKSRSNGSTGGSIV